MDTAETPQPRRDKAARADRRNARPGHKLPVAPHGGVDYRQAARSRQSVASKMKAGTNRRTISRRIEPPFGLTVSGGYSS
jgi:hypothetical protein